MLSARRTRLWLWVSAVALLALGSRCATTRGELDIRVPATANPANEAPVPLVQVRNERVFQIRPSSANIPSLMDDDINNKALTLRAVARKRNGFGKAPGEILLPEGRTVELLVKEALTRAFREAGDRVLVPGDTELRDRLAGERQDRAVLGLVQFEFWGHNPQVRSAREAQRPVRPLSHPGDVLCAYASVKAAVATAATWTEV